jgi:aconitate hydratase
MAVANPFGTEATLNTASGPVKLHRLQKLEELGLGRMDKLPYSIRVLVEACLRNCDDFIVSQDDVKNVACWNARNVGEVEIPFKPGRVVLQDFTGVPAVVDLAALRAAMVRMGGDPKKINPLVQCDLVIDHSVQVDAFASGMALQENLNYEFERNRERYQFLKWGQQAFRNFRVIPPATGIVHQVNLEYLATGVLVENGVAFPDSLVGTDSHTTMINGLGVVGWGVGGIEAEAVMLGQPIYMLLPEVVGFKLSGKLPEGATATDLVLTVTQMLRQHKVVGKFVEFFGPGLDQLPLADRATIANMAPEYGATMGFFPVDAETLRYLERTGRSAAVVDLCERYYKEQNLFRTADAPIPEFSSVLELDMSTVEPSLAGPKRPQDRILLKEMLPQWRKDLTTTFAKPQASAPVEVKLNGQNPHITDGAVVIAAITSCTNTSNPSVMLAAGLLAKKAAAKGLQRKPWVKTSLAPGSRVVTDYLDRAGLTEPLNQLGFNLVGYGCTTCIGNSGPLPEPVVDAINAGNLVAAAVLSGNRNFEGRIHANIKANYLASPPLVVAYAIAGTTDIDLQNDPLGHDQAGQPVYLKDIWPSQQEIAETLANSLNAEMFTRQYSQASSGPPEWQAISGATGDLFAWDPSSTYVQEPPFFVDMPVEPSPIQGISGARCLVSVGDSTTTDHISPAGNIKKDSPAGRYLQEQGVAPVDFN